MCVCEGVCLCVCVCVDVCPETLHLSLNVNSQHRSSVFTESIHGDDRSDINRRVLQGFYVNFPNGQICKKPKKYTCHCANSYIFYCVDYEN